MLKKKKQGKKVESAQNTPEFSLPAGRQATLFQKGQKKPENRKKRMLRERGRVVISRNEELNFTIHVFIAIARIK